MLTSPREQHTAPALPASGSVFIGFPVRVPMDLGMREQLLAERTSILTELADIEAAIAELAAMLGTNLDQELARRLAELINVHKVAKRGRLMARLAVIDAVLRSGDGA